MVLTAEAFPENVAEFDPPGTVTEEGTAKLVLLLVSPITTPADGAVELRETVQLVEAIPVRVVGTHDNEFSCGAGGWMVTVVVTPVLVVPAEREDNELVVETAAEMVTDSVVVAVPAVPVKAVLIEPAGIVTAAGTVRLTLELVTDAAKPPLGAALVRETVQVVDDPESSDDGEQPSDERATGAISASVVVFEVPFNVAVNTAEESAAMVATVAVNAAVVRPSATETEAGTVTEEFPLESATETPPLVAALERVILQVVDDPEATEDGEQLTDESAAGATSVSAVDVEDPLRVAVT